MKHILPFIALLIVFTACKKEDGIYFTATFDQFHSSDKSYIDSDHYACWETGDTIWVNGISGIANISSSTSARVRFAEGSFTESSTYYGFHDGGQNIVVSCTNNNKFTFKVPTSDIYSVTAGGAQQISGPMYVCSSGDTATAKKLPFKNLFGLLKFDFTKTELPEAYRSLCDKIEYIEVQSDKTLSGTFEVTISPSNKASVSATNTNPCNFRRLIVNQPFGSSTQSYYLPIVPVSGARIVVRVGFLSSDHNRTMVEYKFPASFNIQRNEIFPAITTRLIAKGKVTYGAHPGIFKTSAGDSYFFSQGNLWYKDDGTTSHANPTWKFAEEEYYICDDSKLGAYQASSITTTNWIDVLPGVPAATSPQHAQHILSHTLPLAVLGSMRISAFRPMRTSLIRPTGAAILLSMVGKMQFPPLTTTTRDGKLRLRTIGVPL